MSNQRKVTDWFPHDVNPVHVGKYEVRNSRWLHGNCKAKLIGRFRYWDGKRWMRAGPDSIFGDLTTIMGTHETHQWRGLAAPAEG